MNITIRDENFLWIEIEEEIYIFSYSNSNNGAYILAFSDDNKIPGIGNYFLLKNMHLSAFGTLVRPHDGKVGNNGNFIINDWLNYSKRLAGIAYAFNEHGQQLLAYKVKANLLNNGLSHSGEFMIFQTCNSNGSDNNVLFLYDLAIAALVWRQRGGPNWPREYLIKDKESIYITYSKRSPVTLDWEGNIMGTNNKLAFLGWVDERG